MDAQTRKTVIRRVAHVVGAAVIAVNLLWLGLLGAYAGFSSGVIPWPEQFNGSPVASAAVGLISDVAGLALPREVEEPMPEFNFRPDSQLLSELNDAHLPPVRIMAPAIELDSPVLPVTTKIERGEMVWAVAKWAAGHHEGTANPGEPSNIVLAGHISSPIRKEGDVFKRLPDLSVGDTIILHTEQSTHRYTVVERKVVSPKAIEVMNPTDTETLTLITCYPDLIYTHRLVVTAQPERKLGPPRQN